MNINQNEHTVPGVHVCMYINPSDYILKVKRRVGV
jgi:hypothetical protein